MAQTEVDRAHVRYFTLVLRPAQGLVHPADDALADASGLTRESLSHIDSRNGTGTLCYQLRGDPAVLSAVLASRSDVLCYDTIDAGDEFDCYLRVEGGSCVFDGCFFQQGLLVDPPVRFPNDDGLRVTLIGTSTMVRRAMARLPSGVTCSVERLGGADHERVLVGSLTDRQREVIRTAFEMGYYGIPRRTTHDEIAAVLDRSSSTIDEHLRKAESKLMEQLLA